MILENSEFQNKEPKTQTDVPDAIIVGIYLRPDLDKIVADTNKNIWDELRIEPEAIESLTSIEFHLLGMEPIAVDCLLVLNELFK